MIIEILIVAIIVLAAIYIIFRSVKTSTKGGCNCGGCSKSNCSSRKNIIAFHNEKMPK